MNKTDVKRLKKDLKELAIFIAVISVLGAFLIFSCHMDHKERCKLRDENVLVTEKDGCKVYHFERVDDQCQNFSGYYTTCEGSTTESLCGGVPVPICHDVTNPTKVKK